MSCFITCIEVLGAVNFQKIQKFSVKDHFEFHGNGLKKNKLLLSHLIVIEICGVTGRLVPWSH